MKNTLNNIRRLVTCCVARARRGERNRTEKIIFLGIVVVVAHGVNLFGGRRNIKIDFDRDK